MNKCIKMESIKSWNHRYKKRKLQKRKNSQNIYFLYEHFARTNDSENVVWNMQKVGLNVFSNFNIFEYILIIFNVS